MKNEISENFGHVAVIVGDWLGKGTFLAMAFVKAQIHLAQISVDSSLNRVLTIASIFYVLIKAANELKRRRLMKSDSDKK